MRKFLAVILATSSIVGAFPENEAIAAPANPAAILKAVESDSIVEEARWACVNRYSGRIMHWGRCGGYHRRHYYHPHRHHYRYYCINRWTGRFLHWGRC